MIRNLFKHSHNKRFLLLLRRTHTVTITETVASIPIAPTPISAPIVKEVGVIVENSTTINTEELRTRLEENNKRLQTLLNSESSTSNKAQDTPIVVDSAPSNYGSPLSDIIDNVIVPTNTTKPIEDPLPLALEIQAAMTKVKLSSNIVGHKASERMKAHGIALEENEIAGKRQKALYDNIEDFLSIFGIKKRMIMIGLGLGITYTLYNLIRYRQVPFGGFIKGLFSTGDGTTASPSMVSNPISNITINMPNNTPPLGTNLIPDNVRPPSQWMGEIVDSIGNQGWATIAFIILLIKKL